MCWQCERRLRESGRCPFGVPLPKPAARAGRTAGGKAAAKAAKAAKASVGESKCASRAPDPAAEAKAAAGQAAAHPFCPHQSLCATCDPAFESCPECRLAQGDGEAVLAACEAWRPTHLFLDFDRTLCSTRGGANPLVGSHTVDTELQAAASAMSDATHVLTRNRHTREIAAFLGERGVPIVGVHSTPAGASKWDYIDATLGAAGRALFVDDSATEVSDPRMAGDSRVFRLLMQRW